MTLYHGNDGAMYWQDNSLGARLQPVPRCRKVKAGWERAFVNGALVLTILNAIVAIILLTLVISGQIERLVLITYAMLGALALEFALVQISTRILTVAPPAWTPMPVQPRGPWLMPRCRVLPVFVLLAYLVRRMLIDGNEFIGCFLVATVILLLTWAIDEWRVWCAPSHMRQPQA